MVKEDTIDHEVRIRVVKKAVEEINGKINLLIGILIRSVVLPVLLHTFKLV